MSLKPKPQHRRRKIIGAFEAKTHFSELLAAVSTGEEFTITRHGQNVALMIPFPSQQPSNPIREAIRAIKKLRAGINLGNDLSIRNMRSQGRK